jgi:hypothetical protein
MSIAAGALAVRQDSFPGAARHVDAAVDQPVDAAPALAASARLERVLKDGGAEQRWPAAWVRADRTTPALGAAARWGPWEWVGRLGGQAFEDWRVVFRAVG